MTITLAELRRRKLLSLDERRYLKSLDYHKVLCINSVGERICIHFFHINEINSVIKELEELIDKTPNDIYTKTGKTVAFTLATFISFKFKAVRNKKLLKPLPHHKEFEKSFDSKKTYLILDNQTGYYKIGRSINPLNREKTLKAEQPNITLIYTCDVDIENYLHKKYKHKRIRGEWFNLTEFDVKEIEEIYFLKNKEPNI